MPNYIVENFMIDAPNQPGATRSLPVSLVSEDQLWRTIDQQSKELADQRELIFMLSLALMICLLVCGFGWLLLALMIFRSE